MSPTSPARSLRRVAVLVTLLSLALPSGAASAQQAAPVAPLAASLTGEAKASYEGGKLLYENHDYAGAATKFRAAYDASRDARLLWNLATCEKELRHYARAARLVERFIADASALVAPEFVAQAKDKLAALREFYSPVQLTVRPAGTRVFIDGEDVGAAPFQAPVHVDLGTHSVRAEHDGFSSYDAPLDVAGQGAMTLDITLHETPTVAQLVVAPSEPVDTVTVDDRVVGSGHWQGDVTPGVHRLKVTAPGKRPYLLELEIAAGDHRSIEVTLESEHGKLIWPWIAGGAAVVAGGVVAGYLLLKPGSTTSAPPAGSVPTIGLSSFGRWSVGGR